jgi:hypothetical protein
MLQTVFAGITAQPCTGQPQYVAPCVTVVQFAVENGFTDSYTEKLGLTDDEGDINLESRSNDGDNWGGVSDNYWF